MPESNTTNPKNLRVASGALRDGWTYDVQSIPTTNRFRATVSHPYGDDPSGGTPWPIEDSSFDADPPHPTYATVEAAVSAADRYVDRLSELKGYPDPDKMSTRGFRPTIW